MARSTEEAQAGPGEPIRPEELRRDIDSGETRDKVAVTDPAAAPLGADAEAAGQPPSPEARRIEQTAEENLPPGEDRKRGP